MARASCHPVKGAVGPCPSCGETGQPRLRLVTEKQKMAWEGCAFCLDLALRRGLEGTLAALCREADREERPKPNVQALMR